LSIYVLGEAMESGDMLKTSIYLENMEYIHRRYAELGFRNILEFAVVKCDPCITSLVLQKYTNVDTQDVTGYTPLHWACHSPNAMEHMKLLLEHGANPNLGSLYGDKPLHICMKYGSMPCAYLLIDQGADPNTRTERGDGVLHIACKRGDHTYTKKFLEKGLPVDARNSSGHTALHVSCMGGHIECVKLLLEFGSDMHIETNYGDYALLLAEEYEHPEIVSMLHAHARP